MKLEFSYRFKKNTEIPNFMEILPVGVEIFHEDGPKDRQTDMSKKKVDFCNFANVPVKEKGSF